MQNGLLFPNWGKTRSTEASGKLKGCFTPLEDGRQFLTWDGSSFALLAFLGLIAGAVSVPSSAGSTLCAPDISDQESYACKGQTQRGCSVSL